MNNCAWLGIIYREFFRFKLPFSDRFRDILSEFIRFQYSRFTGCNQFMTFPRFSTLTGKKNHTHENDGEFFWSLPTIFTLKCMRWSSSTTYASSHQDKEDMTRWLSIYLSIYVPPYVLSVESGACNLISLIVKKECWLKSWNCVLASRPVRQGQWRWRRRWWENWRRSQFTPVMWPETRGWDSPIWHCRWQGDQAMDNSATVHSYISFSQPPPSDDAEIKARWT